MQANDCDAPIDRPQARRERASVNAAATGAFVALWFVAPLTRRAEHASDGQAGIGGARIARPDERADRASILGSLVPAQATGGKMTCDTIPV
jgi:hypothetical protein